MLDDGLHDDVQVEVGKAPYEIHARLFVVGHDLNLRSRLLVFAAAAAVSLDRYYPWRLRDFHHRRRCDVPLRWFAILRQTLARSQAIIKTVVIPATAVFDLTLLRWLALSPSVTVQWLRGDCESDLRYCVCVGFIRVGDGFNVAARALNAL